MNCEQFTQYDAECVAKDAEIASLEEKSQESGNLTPPERKMICTPTLPYTSPKAELGAVTFVHPTSPCPGPTTVILPVTACRGKVPQVDAFTADDVDTRLDDWLPTLERAAV